MKLDAAAAASSPAAVTNGVSIGSPSATSSSPAVKADAKSEAEAAADNKSFMYASKVCVGACFAQCMHST